MARSASLAARAAWAAAWAGQVPVVIGVPERLGGLNGGNVHQRVEPQRSRVGRRERDPVRLPTVEFGIRGGNVVGHVRSPLRDVPAWHSRASSLLGPPRLVNRRAASNR